MPYKDKERDRERIKQYQKDNREKILERSRLWHKNNSERDRETHARWRREHPKEAYRRKRSYALRSQYGIGIGDYEALFLRQGGVCAICGGPPKEGETLAVDHDHKTNKIRGLVHGNHNRGLGCFGDDPSLLRKAADYLEKHRS